MGCAQRLARACRAFGGPLAISAVLVFVSPATPTLWMRVSPRMAFAPTTLHVTLRVARHADNRWWMVELVSHDGLYRKSAEQLDGAAAAIVHEIWWRDVEPAGSYRVIATLGGLHGVRTIRHTSVLLLARS